MARGTIFLTGYVKRKRIDEDYWYSYLEEGAVKVLRVYKQEQQVFWKEAEIGDAFEVIVRNFNGGDAFITPMTPPRKDWEAIAWLLGFSKHERTSSYQEYVALLEDKREKYDKPGYVESVLEGPHFEFTEYSHVDDERHEYHNLVCYIDEDITKNEIIHLIPEYIYPEQYVRKVLKVRFGVSDEEFDKALSVFD